MTKIGDGLADDRGRTLYLRVGDSDPAFPWSRNHALRETEAGLSVYGLDADCVPQVPEDSEWAEDDMRDRLADEGLPKHLVVGRVVGRGHDGEPLLDEVEVVGTWEPRLATPRP